MYLLPEIALTTQIINRLKKVFGNDVYVYHSKMNDDQRVEIFEAARKSKVGVHLVACRPQRYRAGWFG